MTPGQEHDIRERNDRLRALQAAASGEKWWLEVRIGQVGVYDAEPPECLTHECPRAVMHKQGIMTNAGWHVDPQDVADAELVCHARNMTTADDVDALLKELDFVRQWYAVRWERLRKLIHDYALPHVEDAAVCIMANATADPMEPPTYDQILQGLRSEVANLKAQLEAPVCVVSLNGTLQTTARLNLLPHYHQLVLDQLEAANRKSESRDAKEQSCLDSMRRETSLGKCGRRNHHADCDCQGEGGDR